MLNIQHCKLDIPTTHIGYLTSAVKILSFNSYFAAGDYPFKFQNFIYLSNEKVISILISLIQNILQIPLSCFPIIILFLVLISNANAFPKISPANIS